LQLDSTNTVARHLALFLASKGIGIVYGYQGGAIVKIIDEIVVEAGIKYFQHFHEQSSAFAASAYSKLTGKVGVVIATSGPGATNLITGIADAFLDSVPMVVITGQERSSIVKRWARGARTEGFQDLNIVSIAGPITKKTYQICDSEGFPDTLNEAYELALSGRPGPVLIDIPVDVQLQACRSLTIPNQREQIKKIIPNQIDSCLALIKSSKRPVILIGGGVRGAKHFSEFARLCHGAGIPIVPTLNGIGLASNSMGFSGVYGLMASNYAVKNADTILALGCRFGAHQIGKNYDEYTSANVIHVDIERVELGRVIPTRLAIESSVDEFLESIIPHLNKLNLVRENYAWQHEIQQIAKKDMLSNDDEEFKIKEFFNHFYNNVSDSCNIFVDVGCNQMFAAKYFVKGRERRFITSAGLGTMGFALPAAIGSIAAIPDEIAVVISGDGGIMMNLQEMGNNTACMKNLIIIVLNNHSLGMIKMPQKRYLESRHIGCEYPYYAPPNFRKIADAFGFDYYHWNDLEKRDKLMAIVKNPSSPIFIEVCFPPHLEPQLRSNQNLERNEN
jgi:acetolactate synthase-1/2/3 large subunit